MVPADVQAFVEVLIAHGLIFKRDGQAVDLAVIDQVTGPTTPCHWANTGLIEHIHGCTVTACWLGDTTDAGAPVPQTGDRLIVATPVGWQYAGSLSESPGRLTDNEAASRMSRLRREGNLDVYLDTATGKEMFVGRSTTPSRGDESVFRQLQALANEALALSARGDRARESQDKVEGAAVYDRLLNGLLPAAEGIDRADGKESPFAPFVCGLIHRILGNHRMAVGYLQRSLHLAPDVENTLLELVLCLGNLGRAEEALPYAQRAVKVSPKSAAAWGNLAMCSSKCGALGNAQEAILRALALDPDDKINQKISQAILHDNRERVALAHPPRGDEELNGSVAEYRQIRFPPGARKTEFWLNHTRDEVELRELCAQQGYDEESPVVFDHIRGFPGLPRDLCPSYRGIPRTDVARLCFLWQTDKARFEATHSITELSAIREYLADRDSRSAENLARDAVAAEEAEPPTPPIGFHWVAVPTEWPGMVQRYTLRAIPPEGTLDRPAPIVGTTPRAVAHQASTPETRRVLVTARRAREIAEEHLRSRPLGGSHAIAKVISGDDPQGVRFQPEYCAYSNGPWPPGGLADCWIAYVHQTGFALRSSDVVIVSKLDGSVVYAGSAGDEG